MKLLVMITMLACAMSARATVTVNGAKVDSRSGYIVVDLSYGGCQMPTFELRQEGCSKLQCNATITQTSGDDGCERLNRSTAIFPIAEQGLGDPSYSGITLNIKGDVDLLTGKSSSASVRLP